MVKKIILNLFFLLIFAVIIFFAFLSTIGIETNRFNKVIIDKIAETNNIDVDLKTIKFKLDLKDLSLYLETNKPVIVYKKIAIPSNDVKVYLDFLSLIKTNLKIQKISIDFEEIDIKQINKLSKIIKPSNFKSFLNNKVLEGKLTAVIEIFLNNEGGFKNYIARGKIKSLKVNLFRDLKFSEVNLDFFADKDDIIFKNIFGNVEGIVISNGDVKLNLENGIKLTSNFESKINFNETILKKYSEKLPKYDFTKKIKLLNGNFSNDLSINFDTTYKIKNFNYRALGKVDKGKINPLKNIKLNFLNNEIEEIFFSNLKFDVKFSPKKYNLIANGEYSFNDKDYLKFDLENVTNNDSLSMKINLDYKNDFQIDFINYKKPKNALAKLFIDLKNKNGLLNINNFNFTEGKNSIKINGLSVKNNKLLNFKKVEVLTSNNNFVIENKKKITIKGNNFDATNLSKSFNDQTETEMLKNLNSKIEIDFKNIIVPMSEKLKNFKLIGEIEKGKFVKISSKGDYGGNNFLDISMKKDKTTNKNFLEIYSDLARPLLSEYSFFSGLSGGKLLFTSLIQNEKSNLNLKIENFKVINAPGLIKLLSLADLGGLEDLAKGEGLSFDILEIKIEKNKKYLKINEILALGPSVSILMEGYQDEEGITSLRGTLVPAKTLNKIISKIPVIGNIIIPKEVGEGLFGISFKMKGPKGEIKTTINPIRTLTPRFIQKIVDRNKKSK